MPEVSSGNMQTKNKRKNIGGDIMERTEDEIAKEIVDKARELMLKRDEVDITIKANFGAAIMTVNLEVENNEEGSDK